MKHFVGHDSRSVWRRVLTFQKQEGQEFVSQTFAFDKKFLLQLLYGSHNTLKPLTNITSQLRNFWLIYQLQHGVSIHDFNMH